MEPQYSLSKAMFNVWRSQNHPNSLRPETKEKHMSEWKAAGRPKVSTRPSPRRATAQEKAAQDRLVIRDKQRQTRMLERE
jgi:hypothetical protein